LGRHRTEFFASLEDRLLIEDEMRKAGKRKKEEGMNCLENLARKTLAY
jgi:hypothetical protein